MGKWWSWVPGLHNAALKKCRRDARSAIIGERQFVERMSQRPRSDAEKAEDDKLRDEVLKKIDEIYEAAGKTDDIDELDDLSDDAELQGLFAAYICPPVEIKTEGDLVLEQISGWGIPDALTKKVRDLWEETFKNLKTFSQERAEVQKARGVLYALFAERDGWEDYLDYYDDTTNRTMSLLFLAVVVLLVLAVLAFHFAYRFSPLLAIGIAAAGGSGSCASVMTRMPSLEVSLSGKLDAYSRGVLTRVANGIAGTIIGSALLAWIPLSIQTQSFGDLVSACTVAPCTTLGGTTCTTTKMLILLGIPTLLGFSERTLPFFEQRLFGKAGLPPARSKRRKV
jgi:hypothetical protein